MTCGFDSTSDYYKELIQLAADCEVLSDYVSFEINPLKERWGILILDNLKFCQGKKAKKVITTDG